MKKIQCYFDGACEPKNPGGAIGCGAYIIIDGKCELRWSHYIEPRPTNTNNVAEYLSFEVVLNYLYKAELTEENIVIYGDSKLVIEQMNKRWKIGSGMYAPYAERCLEKLETNFSKKPRMEWVPRQRNTLADECSKECLTKNNIKITDHTKK